MFDPWLELFQSYSQAFTKLEAKALTCVFLGYATSQNGYKCYHPPTRKRFVSMDVTFFESIPYFFSSQPSLQGERIHEKLSLPLPIPLPIPSFDNDGGCR